MLSEQKFALYIGTLDNGFNVVYSKGVVRISVVQEKYEAFYNRQKKYICFLVL